MEMGRGMGRIRVLGANGEEHADCVTQSDYWELCGVAGPAPMREFRCDDDRVAFRRGQ